LYFGLGNPGEKFYKTYHNIGRRLLEETNKNWENLIYSSYSFYNEILLGKSLVFYE
jgi:peptidyl-tRNA hydrolase